MQNSSDTHSDTEQFDAIVIGSGQAGGPLSHRLADRDWKVALIEREHLGGSCVNYGCTPTKRMLASANVAHAARDGARYGVHAGDVHVDMKKIRELKDEIVTSWRGGQEKHTGSRPNITLFRGEGRFIDTHTVEVDGRRLSSDLVVINTGTRPLILPIPGLGDVPYLTNRDVMDLGEAPEHLLVVGGSYIGLEFGQMYRRFGSEVTVVEYADDIIGREDADVSEALRTALEAEGIRFHLASKATGVRQDDAGRVHLTIAPRDGGDGQELVGSHLLLAAGRQPNSDALDLAAAGVETDAAGYISVDAYLETNVPGIYALGDVNGGAAFTHISYQDFQIMLHNLTLGQGEERRSTEGRLIPYALFTEPELGRVGLCERDAREYGLDIKIGKIPMSHIARAIEMQKTDGLMKIVVDAKTDRILGAAVLGPSGGEVVQTLMALMMVDAPWTTFHQAMTIHPTVTEGFFGLMNSVK
jgi:pyruvate/2-oxoglutarate dehydrogenase complex dihydrolipoamide dehydrogenase (E3) component